MIFDPPLIQATLLRRYKRFLADVILPSGEEVTAHCPNPGAMTGLATPGSRIWVEHVPNPKRKLKYTWRLVELPEGGFAGIDTNIPNRIVKEALVGQRISGLPHDAMRAEVRYGANSRVDFLLSTNGAPDHYVEVKNVHLRRRGQLAEFPDCVTARGTKHLHDLIAMREQGFRATMLYVVQMTGPDHFAIAADIDPAYYAAWCAAWEAGVDMLCLGTDISPDGITLRSDPVPVLRDGNAYTVPTH
ncbi:sugar fermentation stimulation protein A [Rubricella aquisinus]|uniref:Sugar fermentation stimulation protein homolog n=1 Tax=Rubricella aquisinus TaxID=2028108 RepID=A0A840WPZ6_9RHOB|nr:DNA/RNA nuclease SfsA [Rubricella aquisinus]MBB5516751.1 sugar fermentation stimulation protein A [Rubricella aquisinus]